MRTAAWLLAMVALAPGCGVFYLRPEIEAPALAARTAGPRPRLLVRSDYKGTFAFLLRMQVPEIHAFTDSGLFASVVHHPLGAEDCYDESADLTLDLVLEDEPEYHWHYAVGIATLTVLPWPYSETIGIHATVRDGQHAQIGELYESASVSTIAWAPLSPVSLLASLLRSPSPFGTAGRDRIDRETVEILAARIIDRLRRDGVIALAADRSEMPASKK
jgi:hypothetical protein